jgi:hypothetical protein
MIRKTAFVAIVLGLALLAGPAGAARMESPNGTVIARDVIAGGGGESRTPGGYVLNGTIGQPIAAVSEADDGTILVGGFQTMWRPSVTAVRHWDLY